MVDDKAGPLGAAIVDRVTIIGSLAIAVAVAPLPEHVAGDAWGG